MPSPRTKKAVSIMVEKLLKNEPVTMGAVLLEAGFSKSISLKPKMVTNTKGYKECLAEIDNEPLLERLNQLALCDDKRISHEAIKTILLDLKGLGSEKVTKIVGLFEKISELQVDDKSETVTNENTLPATQGATAGTEV